MKKHIYLEADSCEGLRLALESMPKAEKPRGSLFSLAVSGPQVIVRNFSLPVLAVKDLRSALRLEAAEVFSLHPEEIEVDCQVLSVADNKSKGVFLAMPKAALKDYYAEMLKAGFIPLALTAKILTTVNAALIQVPSSVKAFYILNFMGEKSAFLTLFNEGLCELLREISFDDIAEAKQEIANSLRYALGKSADKHPEELYFSGEIAGRDQLIAVLASEFNFKSKAIELKAAEVNTPKAEGYFKLNLIKEYAVSSAFRSKLHFLLNVAIGATLLISVFAFIFWLKLDAQVKALKKDFDPSQKVAEYGQKISGLQKDLRLLENEK